MKNLFSHTLRYDRHRSQDRLLPLLMAVKRSPRTRLWTQYSSRKLAQPGKAVSVALPSHPNSASGMLCSFCSFALFPCGEHRTPFVSSRSTILAAILRQEPSKEKRRFVYRTEPSRCDVTTTSSSSPLSVKISRQAFSIDESIESRTAQDSHF